jgi:hypothetical protein
MLWLAATDASSHSGGLGTDFYLALIGGLVFWVVLYFVYRVLMTGRKDFGLPVKRRLLVFHLKVDRDQSADVPMWWTDLQVQRAIRSYWRQSLRSPFGTGAGSPGQHAAGGDTSL